MQVCLSLLWPGGGEVSVPEGNVQLLCLGHLKKRETKLLRFSTVHSLQPRACFPPENIRAPFVPLPFPF